MNTIEPLSQVQKPKVVLAYQTYYISSHHIISWLECQDRGIDCIFLVNNENGIYEKMRDHRFFPVGFKDSIIPFDFKSYLNIGLPLIPFFKNKLSLVNFYNGDYGFYLASNHYSSYPDETYFVKVDHDVLLHKSTWPDFLDLLVTNPNKSLTLKRSPPAPRYQWSWHKSSVSVYGEQYYVGYFGVQGISRKHCEKLRERRQSLFKESLHYREDLICSEIDLSHDLNHPYCEAFFETELVALNVEAVEIFRSYPYVEKIYNALMGTHPAVPPELAGIPISDFTKEVPDAPFWLLHPLKPIIA